MDEDCLKELNKSNLSLEGEDSSKWNFATLTVSSAVLNKLSQKEQAKFQMTEFKRATNEIEHWTMVEEICDLFGVEDPTYTEIIDLRKFKNLTLDDETKQLDLRDISENIPEGFVVKVDWGQAKISKFINSGYQSIIQRN